MASRPRGILIWDDDPMLVGRIIDHLAGGKAALGATRIFAHSSASSAIAMLLSNASLVDIVVCGLQSREMDGVQFLRQLVELDYRGALLLVGDDRYRALKMVERTAGAYGLKVLGALPKPFTLDQFDNRLHGSVKSPAQAGRPKGGCDARQLAMALKERQFINYYQPKVDLMTGKLAGVEALVRWNHPTVGLVLPDDFMPLAEESGLIDGITRVVLADALTQARQWRSVGHDLDIAVNISMRNLSILDFPESVEYAASRSGVPLSSLILEITEGQVMADPRSQLGTLARLRLKGIRLSIDDFGIGYSSMAMLRDLPFDELKVDQSFVHRADQEPAQQAILSASLKLARELGMRSVGEGVHDRADWDFLRRSGCDLAQGFFVGRPMPGPGLAQWHEAWRARFRRLTSGGGSSASAQGRWPETE